MASFMNMRGRLQEAQNAANQVAGTTPATGGGDWWGQNGYTDAPQPSLGEQLAAGPVYGDNGAQLANPVGPMQGQVQTGGGKYDLASVSGEGLMRPFTNAFKFDQTDLEKDRGYQFTLGEGMKALERGASANGSLFSPQLRNAMARYVTGLANTHYGEAYNRAKGEYTMAHDIYKGNQQDQFNRLSSLAGTGQGAANTLGSQGGDYARTNADLITGAGNAQAAGRVGSANAWNQGLSSIGNSAMAYELLRRPNAYVT